MSGERKNIVVIILTVLTILSLSPVSIQYPASAQAPDTVGYHVLHASSSPYQVSWAGSYRGPGYQQPLAEGVLAYRFLDNTRYAGEGRLDLGFLMGPGFQAWRIQDYNILQVSPPVRLGSYAATAYATWDNRLDIYLAVAGPWSYWTCPIANTGDYEEYPAIAVLGPSRIAVYFYNSSDRGIYAVVVDVSQGYCTRVGGGRLYDGTASYRYAAQMTAGFGGGWSMLVFRDYTGVMDTYATIYDGITNTTLRLTYAFSDTLVPASTAYEASLDSQLIPVYADGQLIFYRLYKNGTLEQLAVVPADEWPARAVSVNETYSLVAYAYNGTTLLAVVGPGGLEKTIDTALSGVPVGLAVEGGVAAVAVGSRVALLNLSSGNVVSVDLPGPVAGVVGHLGGFVALFNWSSRGFNVVDLAFIGVAPQQSKVELYLLPGDSGRFLNEGNPLGILGMIGQAEESVYASLAFFEDHDVAEALVEAYRRGVDVIVVVDDDSLGYEAVQYMIAEGVPVYTDANWENETGYRHTMHEKFIVVDGRKVLIGTANPTIDGLRRDYQTILVFEDAPLLARALTVELFDLVAGNYGTWDTNDTYAGMLLEDPDRGVVAATVYQGPEHRLDYETATIPASAGDELVMAEYIFTSSRRIQGLRQAIITALTEGVEVAGVFDWILNEDTPYRFAYELYEAGGIVAFSRGPDLMHAKTMVADSRIAVTGSYNPTSTATAYNDEVLVVYTGWPAAETAEWISSLIDEWSSKPWNVDYHPLVAGFGVDPDYIVIYNPTPDPINLSMLLVGDVESTFRDDEALLEFPPGTLMPGETIIVAANATEFQEAYGILPDYEVYDSNPQVPDLTPYLPARFTGTFNLDPAGDEVTLAMKSPYDPEFIYQIDTVQYGNSTALPVTSLPTPSTPYTGYTRLGSLDSTEPTQVFVPSLAPAGGGSSDIITPETPRIIGIGPYTITLPANPGRSIVAVTPYHALPSTLPADAPYKVMVDIYYNGTGSITVVVDIPIGARVVEAYAFNGTTWIPIEAEWRGSRALVTAPSSLLQGSPILILGSPSTVGGVIEDASGHTPGLLPVIVVLLAAAAVILLRKRMR